MPEWQMKILKTTGRDGLEWQESFNGISPESRDIHYTADHARIYELTYGQTAYLAVYGDNDDYILMPFILRDITSLPFMQGYANEIIMYDIVNPYEYGGPLARLKNSRSAIELYRGFFKDFHKYCLDQGIICEFAVLHPLLANHLPLQNGNWVDLKKRKHVIYIDLKSQNDAIWRGFSKGSRCSVRQARKQGVYVVREKVSGKALMEFKRIYMETMLRNHATERWLFPDSYFSNCSECLGDNCISLFEARFGDIVIAQSLIIHAYQTVYYHLSGSLEDYFYLRPNNLLIYEIALWAKAQGYRWFHLGGGYQPEDSLYRFKSSFSKETACLYTYSRVHDENRYVQLCHMKEIWDNARGFKAEINDFFPAYRNK
jgi:hypothetical protein